MIFFYPETLLSNGVMISYTISFVKFKKEIMLWLFFWIYVLCCLWLGILLLPMISINLFWHSYYRAIRLCNGVQDVAGRGKYLSGTRREHALLEAKRVQRSERARYTQRLCAWTHSIRITVYSSCFFFFKENIQEISFKRHTISNIWK